VDGASDGLFRVGRILAGLDDRRALRVMSEAHDGDIPSLLYKSLALQENETC
jgi:hypothetical protein